jgi:hypothetical protein
VSNSRGRPRALVVRGFFEVAGWLMGLDIMTIHSINQACWQ